MDAHVQTPIHINSFGNKSTPKKKYRSRRRRMRKGQCVAALKAMTAAQIYLDGKVPNLTAAALCCGSSVAYVRAAIILFKSENATMRERVLRGRLLLQVAAEQMKQVARMVHAYHTGGPADRVVFAKTIGSTTLFDEAVALAL